MKRFSYETLKKLAKERNIDDLECSNDYKDIIKLARPAELRREDVFFKEIYVATLSTSKGSELGTVAFSTEKGAEDYKLEQEKNKGCSVEIKKVVLDCRK